MRHDAGNRSSLTKSFNNRTRLDEELVVRSAHVHALAYQAESDLAAMIAPHYRRAQQEGRTLIQSALASAADLKVTKHELRLRLQPLSSPHRSRAVAALRDGLHRLPIFFPGSRLRPNFSVATASK